MPQRTVLHVGLGMLALTFLLRLSALWTPIIDVDESQFAGFANMILSGGTPYVDSVDTKPLGIYWFFAAIFSVFGRNNMLAVHIITILWTAAIAFYCWRIARLLYSERAGILAALFFTIFSTTYIPKIISTSIVAIMMLPLTISIWHLVRWDDEGKERDLFLAGIFFGVGLLFKYQAGIMAIVMALYFLLFRPLYLRHSLKPAKKRALLVYLACGAAVMGFFLLYVRTIGAWEDFIFFSFKGGLAYLSAGSDTTNFLQKLVFRGGTFVLCTFLVWYFGMRECGSLIKHIFVSLDHTKRQCEEYLIFFWFALSLIPVAAGGRFFGHYFLQLMPPLVILAARQADFFLSRVETDTTWVRRRFAYNLFLIGLLIPPMLGVGTRLSAPLIYKALGDDHADLYRPIAAYVKEHTESHEKIFVWGFATPIYFFADRNGSSRFLWCDWLTGRIAGSPTVRDEFFDTSQYATRGSWDMLFADLEKNKPTYFIDTSPGNYHDYKKYPLERFPDLLSYVHTYFDFETTVADAHLYRRKGS